MGNLIPRRSLSPVFAIKIWRWGIYSEAWERGHVCVTNNLSSFLEQRSTSCSSCCFFLVFSSNCACRSASFFCTTCKSARFFSRACRETNTSEETFQDAIYHHSFRLSYCTQLVHLCWSVVQNSSHCLEALLLHHHFGPQLKYIHMCVCVLTSMATARVALASFSFTFLGATTRATLEGQRAKFKVHTRM